MAPRRKPWNLFFLAERVVLGETPQTRRNRERTVGLFVEALRGSGFSDVSLSGNFLIESSHVEYVLAEWRNAGASRNVLAARLAHLRKLCVLQSRPWALSKHNDHYLGQDPNKAPPRFTREAEIDPADVDWSRCQTDWAKASLRLQCAFGLRREEALKVQPFRSTATRLVLHGGACQGGRPRNVDVETPEQAEALAFAKQVAGRGSLIPPEYTYKAWRSKYRQEAVRAGVPSGSTDAIWRGYVRRRT